MKYAQWFKFTLLCLIVAIAACDGDPQPDELEMEEPGFEEVVDGSYMEYDCSPDINDPDFRGIMLSAPEVVTFLPGSSNPITGAFAPVIVCGAFSFEYTTMGLDGDFADSIVIIAVDEQSRRSFRGTMSGIENEIPQPGGMDGDPTAEDFAGDVIGGYFNPNLAVILNLPEQEADYIVYALLGRHESNRVRISVRESGD